MPLKPPFHKQETRYSCVPACLRMVLGSCGVDISESALRTRCDCTPYGTDALMAVDAARALGCVKTAKYTLALEELQTVVTGGHYPIVFVDLHPIDGLDAIHAMVVVDASRRLWCWTLYRENGACLSTSSPQPGRGDTTWRCLWYGSVYAHFPTPDH
jgi:ABC-type bacteriocin/lantibiotic exporter with double-glycine peptidase domain